MFFLIFGLLQLVAIDKNTQINAHSQRKIASTNEANEPSVLPEHFIFDKEIQKIVPIIETAPTDVKLKSTDGTYWIVERKLSKDGREFTKIGRQYNVDGNLVYTLDCTTFAFA